MFDNLKTHKNFRRTFPPFGAVVFFILLFTAPLSVFGKNLTEYQNNLQSAKKSITELLNPNEEDLSSKNYPEFQRKTLSEIRAKLPAAEKIELHNAELETNNQWLHDKLSEYEREEKNALKRAMILSEVVERLEAIEQKTRGLESSSAAERTKDEDKQKLAEILRREEYQKPADNTESFFQKIYREFMEWLRKMFPRPNLPDGVSSSFQSISFFLQMLLYALVLGVIALLIRRFAPSLFERFQNREKKEKRERVVLGERLASDETAQNLFDEAENLARAGNLRGAIRKGYIALLCELADRKIIGLSSHKTNHDYLKAVRGKGELYENMNSLTLNFELHWYGFETANAEDWEDFKVKYKQTVNK